jgi:hypothetical protein
MEEATSNSQQGQAPKKDGMEQTRHRGNGPITIMPGKQSSRQRNHRIHTHHDIDRCSHHAFGRGNGRCQCSANITTTSNAVAQPPTANTSAIAMIYQRKSTTTPTVSHMGSRKYRQNNERDNPCHASGEVGCTTNFEPTVKHEPITHLNNPSETPADTPVRTSAPQQEPALSKHRHTSSPPIQSLLIPPHTDTSLLTRRRFLHSRTETTSSRVERPYKLQFS